MILDIIGIINQIIHLQYLDITMKYNYLYIIFAFIYACYFWINYNWEISWMSLFFFVTAIVFCGYGYLLILCGIFPILMDGINASWFIYIYNEWLTKLITYHWRLSQGSRQRVITWLNNSEDTNDKVLRICCINHIVHINSLQNNGDLEHHNDPILTYLENNVSPNKHYYKKVKWDNLPVYINGISSYQSDMEWVKRIKTEWNRIKQYIIQNYPHYHTMFCSIENGFKCFMLITFISYVIGKIYSIFILPMIAWKNVPNLAIEYDDYNSLIMIGILSMYITVLLLLLYQLTIWIQNSLLMNRINPSIKKMDLISGKKYYQYIKFKYHGINKSLQDIFGIDVTNVILDFLPDCLDCLFLNRQHPKSNS